ncbi:MAG: hypothetical protein AAGA03_02240 [Planctomycetota bacterium]
MTTKFTVVISDASKHDHGWKSRRAYWSLASRVGAYAELGLYWFLCAYFGRRSVRLMRPSELLGLTRPIDTEWLFIGLPTRLGKGHLTQVRYRHAALYDSTDLHGVHFGSSDQSFLLSVTDLVLKNWRDDRWDFPGMRIGLLPIKRPPINNRLHLSLLRAQVEDRIAGSPSRDHDVGFVARPTGVLANNQRVQWLLQLKRDRPQLRLWGGLVGDQTWKDAADKGADTHLLDACWWRERKVGFAEYFAGLRRSKVALAPAGYAPWSYRHFEALYAGCAVVSNDLSHLEYLIPFPRESLVEIPDGGSITQGVDQALNLFQDRPDVANQNRRHLDRWLQSGRYDRRCPDTLDRFYQQMNVKASTTRSRQKPSQRQTASPAA